LKFFRHLKKPEMQKIIKILPIHIYRSTLE
jgi:hypothetical protein